MKDFWKETGKAVGQSVFATVAVYGTLLGIGLIGSVFGQDLERGLKSVRNKIFKEEDSKKEVEE